MDTKNLSAIEIDAIGEILNISLGASATAVSTMLDARVDITTPIVKVKSKDEFEFSNIEPAVGVEINYVEGLDGSNIMLLKRGDVKVIVEMLMGMEVPDEEFELNEMNISAICEVMNQMMGASATALSELLSKAVNISTPVSFEVESPEQFKDKYFTEKDPMVVIGFTLSIAGKLESEFLNLMPIGLARALVAGFFPDGVPDVGEEEAAPQPAVEAAPAPVPQAAETTPAPAPQQAAQMAAPMAAQPEQPQMSAQAAPAPMPAQGYAPQAMDPNVMNSMMQMMDMMRQQLEIQQQQIASSAGPRKIKVQPAPQPSLKEQPNIGVSDENLEMIMDVPMEVSVEIGRTKKLVKDIMEFNKGSLVVLDKLAGEQVDVYVNGQCIARGDVVVVDDNFGIRITEILQEKPSILE